MCFVLVYGAKSQYPRGTSPVGLQIYATHAQDAVVFQRFPQMKRPVLMPKLISLSKGFSVLGLLAVLVSIPVAFVVCVGLGAALAVILANDRLPSMDALEDYRPAVPMRVFSSDGVLIGEFGQERRSVIKLQDVPDAMVDALLAAEDERFWSHGGLDYQGLVRAVLANMAGKRQGASTITQQLAKNFFLSSEQTMARKAFEALLALRIEETLSKEQILEIYINQIYLGERSYGFAAAAQAYYGKPLKQLTIGQYAMLAGVPKAPSNYNPAKNYKRAKQRQEYVLGRMKLLGSITEAEFNVAKAENVEARPETAGYALNAPYVAELARQLAFDQFKDDAYTAGLNVYTTITSKDQEAANQAVRQSILDYDRRYGYRGPEAFIDLPKSEDTQDELIEKTLKDYPDVDDFSAAVVLESSVRGVKAKTDRGEVVSVAPEGLRFVMNALNDKAAVAKRIRPGAVIRLTQNSKGVAEVVQLPEVQGAFVALNTSDGSVRAMVGGFDFGRNKFNRATQAWRQPGSSFKPFIYSAALEKNFMESTVINDSQVFIDPAQTGGQLWEPKNYDGRFDGPMSMRTGLAKSKNMVSIRILQNIGAKYAQDYVTRFGFDAEKNPPYLTLALGAGLVTPLQVANGFAVFANGGYRVEPQVVTRITDAQGRTLAASNPIKAGDESHRVIDARNAFIMDHMMRDVVKVGTATKAKSLKRNDLAGKTGTTNDSHDAWFAGYQPSIVAVAWMGFDQPRKLGEKETGGALALPMWINYMAKVMNGVPEFVSQAPPGVVQIGSDFYYEETRPGTGLASLGLSEKPPAPEKVEEVKDQIF
jgi:penicillin-binding protein 1A